jgi:hypothetical protein
VFELVVTEGAVLLLLNRSTCGVPSINTGGSGWRVNPNALAETSLAVAALIAVEAAAAAVSSSFTGVVTLSGQDRIIPSRPADIHATTAGAGAGAGPLGLPPILIPL